MINVEEITIGEAFLSRIESLSRDGPKLNAILAVSSAALEDADVCDAHLKRTQQLVGRLHGIPVIVKDQVETKNMVTTYGSIIAKDHVPTEDATIVKKMKSEGAIILAKSTMPDWATNWVSTSSLSGITKNPFALDRDPGGSSSGTGAAISANLGILGLGEDTGGSIRVPSSFCGLVGLRTTPGLISRKGLCPLIKTTDCPGPMCRTVRDTALMMDVLAGFDIGDPWTATAAIAGPPVGGSYSAQLDGRLVCNARIGILRSAFGDDSIPDYQQVNKVVNQVLESLSKSGTEFVDITIPDLDHYINFTSTYLTRSRSDIDGYLQSTSPPLPYTCAKIISDGLYHPALDLFEGIAAGPSNPADDPDYLHRLEERDAFQMLVIGLMQSANITAIALPDVKMPAPLHSDVKRWSATEFPTNTMIASSLRMPAITVPAGFSDTNLPIGLELIGMPYAEQHLLGLAFGIEQIVHARKAPVL